jgi:hypothetical protein
MANIFSGVEPPRWLQEIAKPIDTRATGQVLGLLAAGASNAMRNPDTNFITGYQQAARQLGDPNWALKEERMKLDILGQAAQTASALQMMELQSAERAAWLEDIPSIRDFSAMPLEKQVENPLTGLTSKQGMVLAGQLNRAASSSAVAKSMNESKTSYDKRVAEIIKADPEVGVGLALPPNQFPSPTNLRALEIAEERVRIRAGNRATEAELGAVSRGDVPTTRIDDKGKVTVTYRPPAGGSAEVAPVMTELPGGDLMIYNPKTGSFKIRSRDGKESDELSATQLEQIAKASQAREPQKAKVIRDFLLNKAIGQIQGKGGTGKSAAPAGGGLSFDDFQKWKQSR